MADSQELVNEIGAKLREAEAETQRLVDDVFDSDSAEEFDPLKEMLADLHVLAGRAFNAFQEYEPDLDWDQAAGNDEARGGGTGKPQPPK